MNGYENASINLRSYVHSSLAQLGESLQDDKFSSCAERHRCFSTDVVDLSETFATLNENEPLSMEDEILDIHQMMQQLEELFETISKLQKRRTKLLKLALDIDLTSTVDIFFNYSLSDMIVLLETNIQLDIISTGASVSDDLFVSCKNYIPEIPSQVVDLFAIYAPLDKNRLTLDETESLGVPQTMYQLEELLKIIEELRKEERRLLCTALNFNPADTVDVIFQHCMATRISLLNTIRQLDCVVSGTPIFDELEHAAKDGDNPRKMSFQQFKDTYADRLTRKILNKVAECEIVESKDREVSTNKKSDNESLSAIMRRLNNKENKNVPFPPKPKGGLQINMGKIILCAGGDPSGIPAREAKVYDPKTHEWIKLSDMNEKRSLMGLVQAEGKFYAIGGDDGSKELSSVECFSPEFGEWRTIARMNEARSYFGASYTKGVIYVIGGMNSNKAEQYDIKSNQWTKLPDMNVSRFGVGCAVIDNNIYAIGGSYICERYSPDSGRWEKISSMWEKRSQMGLGVLDGFIYAIGGSIDAKALASVERYDSEADTWSMVADMNTPRNGPHVTVMNNLLYAIGGCNKRGVLKSVEVYSPALDKWTYVAELDNTCTEAGAMLFDCSYDVVMSGRWKNAESEEIDEVDKR